MPSASEPPPRPRRSVLYMPGSNARALDKARTIAADALILDLEDACAPDKKDEARAMVCDAVKAGGYGRRELAIRINGLETPWGAADLKAAALARPDAILIPKVNTPDVVLEVERVLQQLRAPESVRIWAMMETPRGILHAEAIATATTRLDVMVMGTNDLAKELRARQTTDRVALLPALGMCLLAARAYDVAIVDGVYNDFRDVEGFEAACRQSLDMGFDGRTLIHPDQVAVANRVFAPSDADLDLARRQIAAFAEAEKAGQAVAVVDGRIVENLHVENARRLVTLASAIAELEGRKPAARKPGAKRKG